MDKKKAFITNVIFYGIIFVFAYLALKYLAPVMLPFIIAFIVVWVLKFPADFFERKLKKGGRWILPLLVTVFYSAVICLVLWMSASIVPAVGSFILQLPRMYEETFLPALKNFYRRVDDLFAAANPSMVLEMESILKQVVNEFGAFLADSSGTIIKSVSGLAASVPSVVVKIIVTIISSYFMAFDFEHIVGFVMGVLPEKGREKVVKVVEQTKHIIKVFFGSYSLLMLLTFIELTIGLSILKVPYAVWIALGIAIFDILPILGTGGILIPWAIIAAVIGEYRMAVGIAILYLVITAIRNTLEPKLVGKQIGLHPLATLISMTVGAKLFGLVGLFGFPLVLSLIVKMREMEKTAAPAEKASAEKTM